jgi:hypothetical protein
MTVTYNADYAFAYTLSLTDGPTSTYSASNPFSIVGRADSFGEAVPTYTNVQFSASTQTIADGTVIAATATETYQGNPLPPIDLSLKVVTAGYDSQGQEGYVVGVVDGNGQYTGSYLFLVNTPYGGAFGSGPTATGTITDTNLNGPGTGNTDPTPVCFYAGTRILTPAGGVPVESLKAGDFVLTSDKRAVPVRWIGRQTVSRQFANPLRVLPIRVKAGAFVENVPSRDLLVSPDHALLVDGVLIQAGALVNGTSITGEENVPASFTYYHVEVDDHSLIFAEGTPAETFVDNVDRMRFDNWDEYQALYPEGNAIVEMPYPRAKAHRQVPTHIRARLAERAQAMGNAVGAAA